MNKEITPSVGDEIKFFNPVKGFKNSMTVFSGKIVDMYFLNENVNKKKKGYNYLVIKEAARGLQYIEVHESRLEYNYKSEFADKLKEIILYYNPHLNK